MKICAKQLGAFIAFLWIAITASAYDFEVDGLYYTILTNGEAVELSNKNTGTLPRSTYKGSIIVPEAVEYNGTIYPVTKIGYAAFYDSKVTKVILPESINEIAEFAFCFSAQMLECVIPDNVVEIKKHAFASCEKLMEVKLPSKLKTLSQASFAFCTTISEIEIPASVTTIEYSSANYKGHWGPEGAGVFWGCSNLERVKFEDGTKSIIFKDVWEGVAAQNSLYANDVFHECPIKYVYLGRVLKDSPYTSLFRNFTTLKEVEIGENVSSIQKKAFIGCDNIATVNVDKNSEISTPAE